MHPLVVFFFQTFALSVASHTPALMLYANTPYSAPFQPFRLEIRYLERFLKCLEDRLKRLYWFVHLGM